MDSLFNSGDLIISVITHIEVLAFNAPTDYLQKVQNLVNIAQVIPLVDLAIIEQTSLIRRETKIKLPDAIIAATALTRNLTIVSRNEKDFSQVKGLKWVNPHKFL